MLSGPTSLTQRTKTHENVDQSNGGPTLHYNGYPPSQVQALTIETPPFIPCPFGANRKEIGAQSTAVFVFGSPLWKGTNAGEGLVMLFSAIA